MKQTYTHILTFLFNHRYFSDKAFKSIELSLAEGTQKLIMDLGIIIKPFRGGFHMLSSNPELLKMTSENESIQLQITCKDPNYINYSELPLYRPSDRLLYFNNLSVFADSKSESYLLHRKEFVGENEVVQSSNGRIQILGFNLDEDFRFTDVHGNEIPPQCISHTVQQSDTFFLSNLPQTMVLFHAQSQDGVRFYYYPKAVWKKPLGIVEIFTNEIFKQFSENGKVEYALNFNRRETIWKYFLVSPGYNKFRSLSIINKSKEQIFRTPQKELFHQNSEALVFESKNRIPLSEQSDENYQLVDGFENGNGKRKIVIKSLPKASAEQLFRDETKSSKTIYSHIYI